MRSEWVKSEEQQGTNLISIYFIFATRNLDRERDMSGKSRSKGVRFVSGRRYRIECGPDEDGYGRT